jgi:hypothetical protein
MFRYIYTVLAAVPLVSFFFSFSVWKCMLGFDKGLDGVGYL